MSDIKTSPEVAVLVTYSSVVPRQTPSGRGSESSEVVRLPVPSKLSLLAALASREALSGLTTGQLWIAGEESYQGIGETTGSLLIKNHRNLLPDNLEPVAFEPGVDRLINTPLQIEAIAERCQKEGVDELTIIGWSFHELRVKRLLRAYDASIAAEYITVEDTLMNMDKAALNQRLEAIGLLVDFQTIMQRGIKDYRRREWFTRQSLLINRKGAVIKWLSRLRDEGRYDDLDAYGNAVMGTTKQSHISAKEPVGQAATID